MEVLTSRLLITPADPAASRQFYGDVLGLAIAREFGPPEHQGIVYFAGGGFLELSGQRRPGVPAPQLRLWLQVRDAAAEYARLQALVRAGELARDGSGACAEARTLGADRDVAARSGRDGRRAGRGARPSIRCAAIRATDRRAADGLAGVSRG